MLIRKLYQKISNLESKHSSDPVIVNKVAWRWLMNEESPLIFHIRELCAPYGNARGAVDILEDLLAFILECPDGSGLAIVSQVY